jgi:hypothetical protein
MSPAELARALKMPVAHVIALTLGERPVPAETALRLERYFRPARSRVVADGGALRAPGNRAAAGCPHPFRGRTLHPGAFPAVRTKSVPHFSDAAVRHTVVAANMSSVLVPPGCKISA